jgi:hypothetical protein
MSIADNVAISVVLLGIALLLVWLAFCAASLARTRPYARAAMDTDPLTSLRREMDRLLAPHATCKAALRGRPSS